MDKPKRVALYARVSTADQTPENQLLDLRRYCTARGWVAIEPAFIDIGISGAKKDRPALQRLMEAVSQRQVDGVLVWKFDRFARSVSHLVNTLAHFTDLGVSFTSYTEGIDTATSQGRMVYAVIAAMAEFERDLIRERTQACMDRLKHEGVKLGRATWTSRAGILSESQRTDILQLQGQCSIRAAAQRVGVSKSIVHKLWKTVPRHCPQEGIQNVA